MALDMMAVKALFFDRDVVIRKAGDANKRVFARFGAFVRRRAKSSIKPVPKRAATRAKRGISEDGTSAPGNPPVSHKGTIRDFIFFSYDMGTKSVVIGPVQAGKSGRGARALEEGGQSTDWRGRSIYIRARPFMVPAFQAELPKVPEMYRGQIR